MYPRTKSRRCSLLMIVMLTFLIGLICRKNGDLWELYRNVRYEEGRSAMLGHGQDLGVRDEVSNKASRDDYRRRLCDEQGHLFTRENEIIAILRELTSDLIELRATLDEHSAEFVEEKYDKLQKILHTLEATTTTSPVQRHTDSKQERMPYFCPETRIGGPYSKRYARSNCSKAALSKTVSIIIDSPRLQTANPSASVGDIGGSFKGLRVYDVNSKESLTRPSQINRYVESIDTPFVYIARDLAERNCEVELERLVDVIVSRKDAVAVGNAISNVSNGYWSHGCLQTRLRSYVLKYERGYHKSAHSCMKCDALEGPFLAKTGILKKVKFREALHYGYYEDWFLRIQGHIEMSFSRENERNRGGNRKKNARKSMGTLHSCPDVISDIIMTEFESSKMTKLADLWDIKKIVNSDGKVYWYGCKGEMSIQKRKCRIGPGMSVPPCCLEKLSNAIRYIMKKCDQHDIACELMEGTLLGAVKFQAPFPWERDADIAFYSGDFDKLLAIGRDASSSGYTFKVKGEN